MKYSKLFVTGCDKNTEWMLPFFIPRFTKHCDLPLMVFDFGMSPEVAQAVDAVKVTGQDVGWFKKPKAMVQASKQADYVCWLDTDCEVRDNIEGIFDHIEPNKMAMAKDLPWTTRHMTKWHNTGVVAFRSRPNILDEWSTAVAFTKERGDQEVLHQLLQDPMRRMIHITDLPRSYNTLRLDLQDGTAPANIKIMHWTGQKGKDKIKELMNER
jgi:hypothetical protein